MRKQQGTIARSRLFITLLALVAVATAAPAVAQVPPGVAGCSIQGIGMGAAGGSQLFKSSGNAALDSYIVNNLSHLAVWFRVLPRVYIIDDAAPNAFFCPMRLGDPNDYESERDSFGTMLLGIRLLASEISSTPQDQPNYTVTAIMAHELAHTLQFLGQSQLPTMQKELQADFMAGWAIKCLKLTVAPNIEEGDVFTTFYKKGDYAFNSPEHHGTKRERLDAFLAGFEVNVADVNVAYREAEAYVIRQLYTVEGVTTDPVIPLAAASNQPIRIDRIPLDPSVRLQFEYRALVEGHVGIFENTGQREWLEVSSAFQNRFTEVQRTENALTLYDASRRLFYRIESNGTAFWATGDTWFRHAVGALTIVP
jgi:hypothetical protein